MTTTVRSAPPWAEKITEEMRDEAFRECECGSKRMPGDHSWLGPIPVEGDDQAGEFVADGHMIVRCEFADLSLFDTGPQDRRPTTNEAIANAWSGFADREGLREMEFRRAERRGGTIPWWLAFMPSGLTGAVWLDARKVAFLMEAAPFDSVWGDDPEAGRCVSAGRRPGRCPDAAKVQPLRTSPSRPKGAAR